MWNEYKFTFLLYTIQDMYMKFNLLSFMLLIGIAHRQAFNLYASCYGWQSD